MVASHRRCRAGFTLIELLVVIAIIAILAAILFPVFARAKAKAQQTRCLSNLKNIATAFQIYAADHDEMLPDVLNGTYGWQTYAAADWAYPESSQYYMAALVGKLESYTKSSDIWYCDMDVWDTRPADFKDDLGVITGKVSYSYCIQWDTVCDPETADWREDQFCPEMGEYGDDFVSMKSSTQCLMMDNGLPQDPSNDPDDYETPHNNMSNIAFWDGHAKALQKTQFSDIHPPLLLPSGTGCPYP